LYLSTLEEADCRIIREQGYNPEAKAVFQYDFLSEVELGPKVPEGLRRAFEEGKPVLFIINPPFGTSCGGPSAHTKLKSGVAKNAVNVYMVKQKMGLACRQLYAQFLYKIACIKHCRTNIGLFSPPMFLTTTTFSTFQNLFLGRFDFCGGMLFRASEFVNVKANWGNSFTLWRYT
jgi:hypothetical protein